MSCNFDCDNCNEMVKGESTHNITIRKLCKLGRKADLHTIGEWSYPIFSGGVQPDNKLYMPELDLVWAFDLKKLEINSNKLFEIIKIWSDGLITPEKIRYIPLAAFEIEASDPSSKIIFSDFHNMEATRASFKFEIIEEIGDMNIKRAERILESAKKFSGIIDSFLLTIKQIKNIEQNQSSIIFECKIKPPKLRENPFRKKINFYGNLLKLIPICEFQPPERKSTQIYTPKLDGAFLLKIPELTSIIIDSLCQISNKKSPDHDLCHYNLIGFEHEDKTSPKHITGGILNLSRHSWLGFLVVPNNKLNNAKKLINNYSMNFGITNVFVIMKIVFSQLSISKYL